MVSCVLSCSIPVPFSFSQKQNIIIIVLVSIQSDYIDPQKVIRIQCLQLWAIFYKKFIYMRAQWMYWVVLVYKMACLENSIENLIYMFFDLQFSFPILAIVFSFYIINLNIQNHNHEKTLSLNLGFVESPEVVLLVDPDLQNHSIRYMDTIEQVLKEENISARYLTTNSKSIEDGMFKMTLNMNTITFKRT